jgi:hypothetical protein
MSFDDHNYDDDPQEHTTEVVVPSNPADRKKLRGMLEEIVLVLQKNDDNRVAIKIIKDEIKKQFNLAPKYSGRLAGAMHKDNFAEQQASQTDFEFLYDAVVRAQPAPVAQFGEEDVRAAFSDASVKAALAALKDDAPEDESPADSDE